MENRFRHKQQTKQFQNVSSQTCLRLHLSIFYHIIKDARSVFLYPYNRSQILQYVTLLNKLTLQKEWQKQINDK